MKKLLAILLCFALCFAFVACSPSDGADKKLVDEGADAPKGVLTPTIISTEVVKDANGADALAVKMSFTNGMAEPISFRYAMKVVVEQGGAALTPTALPDDSPYAPLITTVQNKINTDESIECVMVYTLTDKSAVKVTVTPKKGDDKTPLEKEVTL